MNIISHEWSVSSEVHLTETTFPFPDLLAENGRLDNTPGVISAFSTMMSVHRGEVPCTVTTASVSGSLVPLDLLWHVMSHILHNEQEKTGWNPEIGKGDLSLRRLTSVLVQFCSGRASVYLLRASLTSDHSEGPDWLKMYWEVVVIFLY